jgi:uncharacterized membrane protein
MFILKFLALLGCGLMAGVFFAFSTFVMPALARLEPAQGTAAMQSINIKAINPWFMTALFATALVCLAIAVFTLLNWNSATSIYLLAGSLLYLVGTIGVTIIFNVPLNEALAIAKPENTEATIWAEYLTSWTFWNHIRTFAAFAATALFASIR